MIEPSNPRLERAGATNSSRPALGGVAIKKGERKIHRFDLENDRDQKLESS